MKQSKINPLDEVYVVGFVPCCEVPNLPESLDPFLQPFMNDLCNGFIQGFEVDYPRESQLRAMNLLVKKLCDCYNCAGQLTSLGNAKQGSFWTKGNVDVVSARW